MHLQGADQEGALRVPHHPRRHLRLHRQGVRREHGRDRVKYDRKVLSRILFEKYVVHMIAPPERKQSVKTDARDGAPRNLHG